MGSATEDNAHRTAAALNEFGFTSADPKDFLEPNQMIRMGVAPIRIEILTTLSGAEFEECYARRKFKRIDDLEVPVIAPEDLIANKLASGRLKDLVDVERLKLMTKNRSDET